jgi:hypothetical protein
MQISTEIRLAETTSDNKGHLCVYEHHFDS